MTKINIVGIVLLSFLLILYFFYEKKNSNLNQNIQEKSNNEKASNDEEIENLKQEIKDLKDMLGLEQKSKNELESDKKSLSETNKTLKKELAEAKKEIETINKKGLLEETKSSSPYKLEESFMEGIPQELLNEYITVSNATKREKRPSFFFVVNTGSLRDAQRFAALGLCNEYELAVEKLIQNKDLTTEELKKETEKVQKYYAIL